MMTSWMEQVKALMPMHHNYTLPDGTHTRTFDHTDYPKNMINEILGLLPSTWKGLKILDIGCNAGWVTRYVTTQGACCLGIDIDQHYLDQSTALNVGYPTTAEFRLADFLKMADGTITDEQKFDGILFMGVIYHMPDHTLAFPALKKLLRTGGWVLLETACEASTRIYSGNGSDMYNGDPTNHWVPSQLDVITLAEKSGFIIDGYNSWIPNRLAVKFVVAGDLQNLQEISTCPMSHSCPTSCR